MLWNVKPEGKAAESPLEFVTVTSAAPEECAGVTASIVVELLTVTEAAGSPPIVTEAPD